MIDIKKKRASEPRHTLEDDSEVDAEIVCEALELADDDDEEFELDYSQYPDEDDDNYGGWYDDDDEDDGDGLGAL